MFSQREGHNPAQNYRNDYFTVGLALPGYIRLHTLLNVISGKQGKAVRVRNGAQVTADGFLIQSC